MSRTNVAAISVAVLPLLALELQPAPPAAAAPHWVGIPAGSFDMGCVPNDHDCDPDEQPRHRVTLSHPFELLATEVTIGQFRASGLDLPEQPSWNRDANQPVLQVTWSEAQAYCQAIGGRLPTEAEWEYAARGGSGDRTFVWGNEPIPLVRGVKQANVADETAKAAHPRWQHFFAGYDDGYAYTAPVGSFAPNGYGLYDMAGNAWEWVSDWYDEHGYQSSASVDPRGPSSGTQHVLRGGCWDPKPADLRVSNRLARDPMRRDEDYGVRCARDVASGGSHHEF